MVEAVGSRKRFRVVQGGQVTKELAKWEEMQNDRLLVAENIVGEKIVGEKIVGEKRRKKQKLRSEPRDGVDMDFEPESGEGMVS